MPRLRILLSYSLLPFIAFFSYAQTDTSHIENDASAQEWTEIPEITLTSYDALTSVKNNDDIPFDALRTFVDVFDSIKRYYVFEVSNEILIDNAIKGMLSQLDPHSIYMNPDEYHDFQMHSEGEYAGIGVVLDIKAGSMQIVSAIEGSPADLAGLQSGDVITQVDGQNVAELTLSETAQLMSGTLGSEVRIILLREDKLYDYRFTREIIATNSVSGKMLDATHALIRISQFQEDTGKALQHEIQTLSAQYPLDGIIIDLRNNPGGYLNSAIESSNLFLTKGTILTIRGRDNATQEIFNATEGDILNGAPIVILVDHGSASSAEIMAAALGDNQRAIVVGQPTFGKGSVQTITPLYHGGAVKMTTANYFTPSGQSIQAQGIIPQVILTPLTVTEDKSLPIGNLRETALPHYLRNPNNAATNPESTTQYDNLAKEDFPLYEALNILTTMSLMQKTTAANNTHHTNDNILLLQSDPTP